MVFKKLDQDKIGLCSRILNKISKNIRRCSGVKINYRYKGFSIELPSYHLLPEYQKVHPKYDRFLPCLVKFACRSDVIVDVGANVGDTLAGMVEKNALANYVCIEPDDSFFEYLENNVKRIKSSIGDLNVQTVKALVGKSVSNVSLCGEGGTKHAVLLDGNAGVKSLLLDEIISDTKDTAVRILKSDVDGFDYDVLDSSMPIIEKHKPILFFECQYDYEYQKDNYVKTMRTLEAVGYCDWTVFDNFGEIVIRTGSMDVILQLMNYVWQQNAGKTTRTINYYDILAVQGKDSALIDKVLVEYGGGG